MEPVITAGLDGSAESLAAARWAAGEAQLRNRPLRLMHAWILLAPPGPEGTAASDQNYWARRIIDDAEQAVHERYPDLPVVKDLVADDPGEALVAAAGQSEMLVLGSRGLEPLTNYFLGDTGLYVMTRADRPVVLVRRGAGPEAGAGTVVLGLSLRSPCEELVEFAFDAAALRGASLRVVHSLHRHPHFHARRGRTAETGHRSAEDKEQELREAVRPWHEKYPSVPVKEIVRDESAARAVMAAAADATMLVVGRSRRHHRRPGPHLGPVLQAAVHHAQCPLAVIPHD